jgi:hypothetical protein
MFGRALIEWVGPLEMPLIPVNSAIAPRRYFPNFPRALLYFQEYEALCVQPDPL